MHTATSKRTAAASSTSQRQRATTLRGVLALLIIIGSLYAAKMWFTETPRTSNLAAQTEPLPTPTPVTARRLSYKVIHSYPHDPHAFLQGLLWYDGGFYESTGLEGRSSLRRVEFPSGKVLQMKKLPPDVFGEGLAQIGDRLFQITWQSQRGFIYDRKTFRLLQEFSYQGEGWGITYDGKYLIMSNGSDVLTYLDPDSLRPVHQLSVTMNGQALRDLNELEWINGEIWANVWQTNYIVRINPANGQVTSYLDLQGILSPKLRTGQEDVLNGIAYDEQNKRIFVGGKLWPRLFEIQVES